MQLRFLPAAAELQTSSDTRTVIPAEIGAFVTEIKAKLSDFQARMKAIAEPIFASVKAQEARSTEPFAQATAIEIARADLASATLDREIAELALAEYDEYVVKDEKAATQGHARAGRTGPGACQGAQSTRRGTRGRSTKHGRGLQRRSLTTENSGSEPSLSRRMLDEPKALLVVRQARSKLKVLTEFGRPEREQELEELKKAVERARAVERAKQQIVREREATLKKINERGTKPALSRPRAKAAGPARTRGSSRRIDPTGPEGNCNAREAGRSPPNGRSGIESISWTFLIDQAEQERAREPATRSPRSCLGPAPSTRLERLNRSLQNMPISFTRTLP